MLLMLLTGCFGDSSKPESAPQRTSSPRPSPVAAGNAVNGTILELKKKYGSDKDKAIMPMYNVAPDQIFTFTFKSHFEDILPMDVISVHTDIKAEEQSKISAFVEFTDFINQNVIEVKPGTPILPSSKELKTGWGNAPIYYIRINYDPDAETPTKLTKPIIVPFTVKSELPIPTLKYEIDSRGNFKLTWNPVEGATSYRIYNVRVFDPSSFNRPIPGPETGYAGQFPQLEREVTETELHEFLPPLNFDNNYNDNDDDIDLIISQNLGVEGDYYVTAVNGDKESNFSNSVSTFALSSRIPGNIITNIGFERYDSLSELPSIAQIRMIDGTIVSRNFTFDYEHAVIHEYEGAEIHYTVPGTNFTGYVVVKNATKEELEARKAAAENSTNSGTVEPDNTTGYVPAPNVPTIIDPSSEASDNITDQQRSNTEKKVDEGNQEFVPAPEAAKEVQVNADTALEEYLALSMMDGQERISLKAFPEAQNFSTLADVMKKVVYQNPLILGVSQYGYDYGSLTLAVKYDYRQDEIKNKQKEIIAEARKIVSSIVKSGMTDDEKRLAIYDYLNEHTRYDVEALDDAKRNNFENVDARFNDSFNTYGIMVKKVGVCASYASTYKMLSGHIGA
jgi:hypothetical protein